MGAVSPYDGAPAPRRFVLAVPLAILLALLLAACAAHPPRPTPPIAVVPWAERLAALRSIDAFELNGRLAASNGTDAVSAGVRWREQSGNAGIDLSGPLGMGAAHIEQNGSLLSVTNSQGIVYRGPAAGAQVVATLGFEVPLQSLRYWVLGASDPQSVTEQSLDAQQRLTHLMQQGWRIDYEQYTRVRDQWLPRRLTISSGSSRLRLVINRWQLGAHAPAAAGGEL